MLFSSMGQGIIGSVGFFIGSAPIAGSIVVSPESSSGVFGGNDPEISLFWRLQAEKEKRKRRKPIEMSFFMGNW